MDSSLEVSYTPKIITKRKEYVIHLYFKRFWSPYMFIVWFCSALEFTSCYVIAFYLPFITLISSVHVSFKNFQRWKKDLEIIQNSPVVIKPRNKCHFFLCELLIQSFIFTLSIWWVKGINACLPFHTSLKQGLLYIAIFLLSFIVHVANHVHTKKYKEIIVRTSYDHVTMSGV
jgi:hypothetical protein